MEVHDEQKSPCIVDSCGLRFMEPNLRLPMPKMRSQGQQKYVPWAAARLFST
jgi:hypothetical protein